MVRRDRQVERALHRVSVYMGQEQLIKESDSGDRTACLEDLHKSCNV